MVRTLQVLIGTQALDLGSQISIWVRELGYEACLTPDGEEAVAWARRGPFAASFLDNQLGGAGGETVWRVVRPILGRRLVLMARERLNELWFEALQVGVRTVLPLPPARPMVEAALAAVDVA